MLSTLFSGFWFLTIIVALCGNEQVNIPELVIYPSIKLGRMDLLLQSPPEEVEGGTLIEALEFVTHSILHRVKKKLSPR